MERNLRREEGKGGGMICWVKFEMEKVAMGLLVVVGHVAVLRVVAKRDLNAGKEQERERKGVRIG